jgi:GDPmannose 4,6-dehydratase
MFNHESPLRSPNFVTRKIVRGAIDVAAGRTSELVLGRLDIQRDWGYASDYVEAMWLMLQQPEAHDFVVATGVTHSLRDFVKRAFEACELDWRDYVRSDTALFRPQEIDMNGADPSKAHRELGWRAETSFDGLVDLMVEAERGERRR